MTKRRTSGTSTDAPSTSASIPAAPDAAPADAWSVASHEALFASQAEPRCDACGGALPSAGDDDLPYAVGRGVYVFARGSESRVEHAPLCASCASAIGMSALARWEIEEEEG
jgi:hypothetical protein